MKRALPLFVPSLTGCVLVASLVLCRPDVSGARAGPLADGPPPATLGTKPRPLSRVQIGMASWYGRRWQGRPTASGERYDRHQPTAAHRTAPLGTQAVVTNLANGHTVLVRINDRGPHKRRRILDLSYEAARRLDMVRTGAARVKVEFLAASPPFA
jgi:rare lipoprotein A